MIIKKKLRSLEQSLLMVSSIVFLIIIFIEITFTTNYVTGALTNITNVTVFAYLNVTNTPPNISSFILNYYD